MTVEAETFVNPDAKHLWEQLKRIGDALEILAMAVMEPEPEPVATDCPHPPEQRISFGMTNGQEDWQCGICQYRTVTS